MTPVTEERVCELETLIGARLPNDYREFLKGNVEVVVDKEYSFEEGAKQFHVIFSFGRFLEFDGGQENWLFNDLEHSFRVRTFRPDDALQIASCVGSQKILLSFSKEHFGRVYYFDSDICTDWGPTGFDYVSEEVNVPYSDLFLLAQSFSGFVDRLRGYLPD
jgi:SMI1 / KNR4 family (SUKH-1)